ncbi:MAG: DUF6527 family protein [Janthinobacterium lividum]
MKTARFAHRFVDRIPETLDEGVLYVAMDRGTMLHLCACGCRSEVVTPLGRTDWRMAYDGEAVTVEPSIGNWSLPCRAHYFISGGAVQWAGAWSDEQVERGRRRDRQLKASRSTAIDDGQVELVGIPESPAPRPRLLTRIASWFHL